MQFNSLGQTDIQVSKLCLGTMTFGQQNSQNQAFRLLDMAFDAGINFVDTAEMYSFPASCDTHGASEVILGNWMKARNNRDKVIISTKITGPGARFQHIRGGDLKFNKTHIQQAVKDSLNRLQTDYIDLYHTHWPERSTNFFGQLDYTHDENKQWTPFAELLTAMGDEVIAGRLRAIAVSNETPWGVLDLLRIAENQKLPRIAAIQNPYNLLCRPFEVGLSEIAIREQCGLLAYSPLAFGALTGKYLNDALPKKSRLKLFPEFKRYYKPLGIKATERYVNLAREHGLEPAVMALAFVNSKAFLTSNIIGATTVEQLQQNLSSISVVLPNQVLQEIQNIHNEIPNPAP